MERKIYIHATNVHQGGGRALLSAILKVSVKECDVVALLDRRMPVDESEAQGIKIKRVEPSMLARFQAERWLAGHSSEKDTVLCFGNLPPLFKLRGRAVVFVQNRYLIDDIPLRGFPLLVRLRLAIERMWFARRISNANEFIVQTPTMKALLENKVQGSVPIRILPFVAEPKGYARGAQPVGMQRGKEYDFVYVASGEPHKNHLRLIEAWRLLAKEGIFPSLCLTLDEPRFAGLCDEIKGMQQQHGLRIDNIGELSHQEALSLYGKAAATINPSLFESFGLPLIEARQARLPVLAAELDYVRDVIDPEQTFDPGSPVSIARAVKRFMAIDEPALHLLTAEEFLAVVGEKTR